MPMNVASGLCRKYYDRSWILRNFSQAGPELSLELPISSRLSMVVEPYSSLGCLPDVRGHHN